MARRWISLILPALDQKIIGSKGLNVKNPSIVQTPEGVRIELAEKNRDLIDSIIILEID